MSAGWGIRVSRSELTGHWVVEKGNQREGFRHWQDAFDEANRIANTYREWNQRVREADEHGYGLVR